MLHDLWDKSVKSTNTQDFIKPPGLKGFINYTSYEMAIQITLPSRSPAIAEFIVGESLHEAFSKAGIGWLGQAKFVESSEGPDGFTFYLSTKVNWATGVLRETVERGITEALLKAQVHPFEWKLLDKDVTHGDAPRNDLTDYTNSALLEELARRLRGAED